MLVQDQMKKIEEAVAAAKAVQAAVGDHAAMTKALDAMGVALDDTTAAIEAVADELRKARRRRPWWCWCC